MKLINKLKFAGLFSVAFAMQNRLAAQDPNQAMQQAMNQDDYSQPAVVTPPDWAPPYDNPAGVQYYYIPDIECYYDVWHHEFAYMENGSWLFSPYLPAMYASYDLLHGHIVVLDRMV